MTLTVERELTINGGKIRRLALLAGAALPVRGALLSWHASGYVHALVAGEAFAGVCDQTARGGGYVDVVTGEFDLLSLAAIPGISLTDIAAGTQIYASDDATLTATAGGNTRIGAVAAIDGVRVVVSAATINAAKASTVPASGGGLIGPKTLVVNPAGDDVAAALSKYTVEFGSIHAASLAAVSGDNVVIRAGTYTGETIRLKTGVSFTFMAGALVIPAGGNALFDGVGATVSGVVKGHGHFYDQSQSDVMLANLTAGSTLRMECDKVEFLTSIGVYLSSASAEVSIIAREIRAKTLLLCDAYASQKAWVVADEIDDGGNGYIVRTLGSNSGLIAHVHARGGISASKLAWLAGHDAFVDITAGGNIETFSGYGIEFSAADNQMAVRARAILFNAGGVLFSGSGNHLQMRADYTISAQADLVQAGTTNFNVYAEAGETIHAAAGNRVLYITSGWGSANFVSGRLIEGGQLVEDNGDNQVILSMKAPWIYGTNASQTSVFMNNDGGSVGTRYDFDFDQFHGSLQHNQHGTELHMRGNWVHGNGVGGPALNAAASKTFLDLQEMDVRDDCPYSPIYMGSVGGTGGEVHIMKGRIKGPLGQAEGHAVTIQHDTAKLRLYPGAVLIAGDDVATKSIGVAAPAATPTVLAMGAIAANKAADGGVVVAVGSLLVDAAVV